MSTTTATAVGLVVAGTAIAFVAYMSFAGASSSSSQKKKSSSSSTSKRSKTSSSSSSSSAEREDGEDEALMKGYKTTSAGNKTSYFSRELSAEDKAILAQTNSGPKLLSTKDASDKPVSFTPKLVSTKSASSVDDSPRDNSSSSSGSSSSGSSSGSSSSSSSKSSTSSLWNQAGTFEERDVSAWAKAHLSSILSSCVYDCKGGLLVKISRVSSVEGDAQVVNTRGKKKCIYDLTASCDWKIEQGGKESASGRITISDISGEMAHEFHVAVLSGGSGSNSSTINTYIKSSSKGLQTVLNDALLLFLNDFKEK